MTLVITGALYLVDMGGTGNMSKALNKVQTCADNE